MKSSLILELNIPPQPKSIPNPNPNPTLRLAQHPEAKNRPYEYLCELKQRTALLPYEIFRVKGNLVDVVPPLKVLQGRYVLYVVLEDGTERIEAQLNPELVLEHIQLSPKDFEDNILSEEGEFDQR
jgi:hypothetical protein